MRARSRYVAHVAGMRLSLEENSTLLEVFRRRVSLDSCIHGARMLGGSGATLRDVFSRVRGKLYVKRLKHKVEQ